MHIIDVFYMTALINEAIAMDKWQKSHKHDNWKVKKVIEGYGRKYLVCRNGLVYNKTTDTWLKPQKHKNGYLYVGLYLDGKRKNVYLHRLVAEYFIPNPKGFDIVYHLDGNKFNNRAENIGRISKSLLQRDYNPENPPSLVKTLRKPRKSKKVRSRAIRPKYLEKLQELQDHYLSLPSDSPERKALLNLLKSSWADARKGLPVNL